MRCARAIAAGPKVDSQTQPVFDDEGGDDDDDGGEAEFGNSSIQGSEIPQQTHATLISNFCPTMQKEAHPKIIGMTDSSVGKREGRLIALPQSPFLALMSGQSAPLF